MRKVLLISTVIALTIVITLCLLKEEEIDGIKIPQDAAGFTKKVEYKTLVRNSIGGNIISLKELIEFDCGGASGCYTHGEVLVKIIDHIGEGKIINIIPQMNIREKSYFKFLLMAGLEYGEFKDSNKSQTLEIRFPRLSKALVDIKI